MPKENTKPELHTQKLLRLLDVEYVTQYSLGGYYYDLYVPGKKLLIEVQGDFFHGLPLKYKRSELSRMQLRNYKRDRRKQLVAVNRGYRIIYIWEHDLNHRARTVKKQLQEAIDDQSFVSRVLLENIFPEYAAYYRIREEKRIDLASVELQSVLGGQHVNND